MHQIAKINHCETSILEGNGIAVKRLANGRTLWMQRQREFERSGWPLEYQGTDYLPWKKPAGLPWYSLPPRATTRACPWGHHAYVRELQRNVLGLDENRPSGRLARGRAGVR